MDSTSLHLAGASPLPATKTPSFPAKTTSQHLHFAPRRSFATFSSLSLQPKPRNSLSARLFAATSSSSAEFLNSADSGDGAGGDGDGVFDGHGGGGGGDGEGVKVVDGVVVVDDGGDDVIVLYVGGMSCKGCAGKVKRLLESQPQVSLATVDLEKETAFVLPVPEIKETEDWKQQLGVKLAQYLTTCGFTSDLRGNHAIEGEESKQ